MRNLSNYPASNQLFARDSLVMEVLSIHHFTYDNHSLHYYCQVDGIHNKYTFISSYNTLLLTYNDLYYHVTNECWLMLPCF